MSTIKQKELPPTYGEDRGLTTYELIELAILTLIAFGMGGGFIWFIVKVIGIAITM